MASASFLERFKDRSTLVGRQGVIDTVSSKPVSRAESNSPSRRMRSTGQMVVRRESPSHRPSLSLSSKQESPVKPSSSVRASIEFTPYSQQEYEALSAGKSVQLGGLGSQVGSERWRQQREVSERRAEYARLIQEVNSVRLPGSITLQQVRGAKKLRGDRALRQRSHELSSN